MPASISVFMRPVFSPSIASGEPQPSERPRQPDPHRLLAIFVRDPVRAELQTT
jgi:hypothetical protein